MIFHINSIAAAAEQPNSSRVRIKDTKLEKVVRSLLHRLGCRFRLHGKTLPGKPDIVLARHRKVIFIHGCFWHRHGVCRTLSVPTNNPDFWAAKFADNVRRDSEKLTALREAGWKILVVWECETKNLDALGRSLRAFMNEDIEEATSRSEAGVSYHGEDHGID